MGSTPLLQSDRGLPSNEGVRVNPVPTELHGPLGDSDHTDDETGTIAAGVSEKRCGDAAEDGTEALERLEDSGV